jgi:hypothetical protein
VRSTTFLFTTLCTSIQNFWENAINVGTPTRLEPHRAAPRRTATAQAPDRLGVRARVSRGSARPESPLKSSPPRAAHRPAGRRPTDRQSGPCPHGRVFLPRPAPAPRHIAVGPTVASKRACRIKREPLLQPRRTRPPPPLLRAPPPATMGAAR